MLEGIGETGLDYHEVTDINARKKQEKLFRIFIELAEEYELPLVVHARDAEKNALSIVKKNLLHLMMLFFTVTGGYRNSRAYC